MWFLAVIRTELPPLMSIEFLHRIADVLKDYLGEVREDVVKENFLLLYQAPNRSQLAAPRLTAGSTAPRRDDGQRNATDHRA